MRDARPSRHVALIAAMVIATIAIAALSVWDTEQQSAHAVERLAQAQATLARALTMDFERRLSAEEAAGPGDLALKRATDALLADSKNLGAPQPTLVFIGGPATAIPALAELATMKTAKTVILPREDAVKLGLPERRAVAAWWPTSRPGLGVMVIASASFERRDAQREEFISVLSILIIVAMVLGFGVTAVRREQQRLELAHVLERQRLERERDDQLAGAERIAVASALSLGIAHELATPLGVIAAKVEGLRRQLTDEKSSAALAIINEQIVTMRQMMQGFLSLARGDAPSTTQLSPETIARSAAKAVLHRFTAASVQLDVDVPSTLPLVWADENLVRQALVNLLVNAAEASPAGGRVTLRLAVAGGQLELRVIDEGHGIAPEVVSQVMRPFVTTRAQRGGTGLGLAITQELARHHGGTVSLAPAASGHGTEAILRLPLSNGGA